MREKEIGTVKRGDLDALYRELRNVGRQFVSDCRRTVESEEQTPGTADTDRRQFKTRFPFGAYTSRSQ
ncbi:MAG TPA: hypothetical protein VND64_02965, partial [Pirellulales bacterium]|nr:hypothetical protein [Pirellulales bacterium]